MGSSSVTIDKHHTQETVTFLHTIESIMQTHYRSNTFPNEAFPREDWKRLTDNGLLLSMIPVEYGGRDSHEEICALIEIMAKYNLPLSMYTMIITLLFIRNVAKYGSQELKDEVLPLFSTEALVGGFALTEPHCGSNLSRMCTVYRQEADGRYHITGQKHWQAFSLSADWWLIAAKNAENNNEFGYFIVKRSEGFRNVEEYNALGLKAIDYGRNEIDAYVPAYRRLNVSAERLDGAIDMLCASRLSMCAMSSGFIGRIYEEATERAAQRKIGNGALQDIAYVQYRLKLIGSGKTISQALLSFVSRYNDFRNVLTENFFEAQAIKALSTDKMLEGALNYQQICGGDGYRYNAPNNSAAYALLDSRVYTVFDGTNDLLYQQITEYCLKLSEGIPVSRFLATYDKTRFGLKHANFDLSILDKNENQAQKVFNGQIIARIFGLNCLNDVMQLDEVQRPFEYDEYINAVSFLIADIKKIIMESECFSRI
ncbi:acyl-CoA dehydrogenase family protein [Edaphocola aurantiacus]|uniref:acyl-CoA dehydrogenase family protein n=1 Tax=Edaphocola aurantiacus TaxID=2601682 RepID=UPI001C95F265|nr:acyl-CoA dehydrogenase family protein [Edaphocola aurantiacus]